MNVLRSIVGFDEWHMIVCSFASMVIFRIFWFPSSNWLEVEVVVLVASDTQVQHEEVVDGGYVLHVAADRGDGFVVVAMEQHLLTLVMRQRQIMRQL